MTLRPDAPALADQASQWASAYVHVPFCARICPYCDFAVVEGRDDLADRYCTALENEIARTAPWQPLDAVFVGGGTPSRFGAERLARVVKALDKSFGLAGDAEVTLEANPEDWTGDLGDALVASGYTRVSFGAQSFDPQVLHDLGRRHEPETIRAAAAQARQSGFRSVSIDLIFGCPSESADSWRHTLEAATALQTDHVSCYALTVERGTPLGRSVAAGSPAPDPDLQADQYEMADGALTEAGLVRYEVSNWARPGHVCRYNLSVWGQGEYLAFGNGAHGFRDGSRYRNIRRLDAYLQRVESGESPVAGSDSQIGWEAELDRVFVGLRRAVGVASGPGVEAFVESRSGGRLLDAGVMEVSEGRLRMTNPLLTDAAERAVLALEDPQSPTERLSL